MRINFHIDRLVLEGIALTPKETRHLEKALCARLGTLLHSGSLPPPVRAGGAYSQLRASDIRLPAEGGTAGIGAQIAQSVYGGLERA